MQSPLHGAIQEKRILKKFMKFEELGLIQPILRAVRDEGYVEPSAIQQQAIPSALAGHDVLGCAQTGTGKTAAFAIPILQRLDTQRASIKTPCVIRALVLTPTRELAIQIKDSFQSYGRYMRLRSTVVFGGVPQTPQVDELRRGVDILVATPGRLNDLIGQGIIDLSSVSVFVLDEADRMLDMGFIHDVERVINHLPNKRQTLFFSATMPKAIMHLCDRILTDPVKVAVTPVSSPVEAIEQRLYFVDKPNKRRLLIYLLEDVSIVSALVFTFTKHGADRVARELVKAGIKAQAIHGDKSQGARQRALSAFKNGDIRVLVATDIAARGIDIDELSHVFNYDLPNIPETYVHRIGRTGRAGLGGTAISFCSIAEMENLNAIEKLIGRKIPVVKENPYPMQVFEAPPKEPRPPRPARAARGESRAHMSKPGPARPKAARRGKK